MTLTIETAAGVLSAVRLSRRGEHEELVAQLELACEWAYQHPAEAAEIDAATFGDSPVTVAGPGAPLVSEFCVAEFAAAMGMATDPGKYFIGEAMARFMPEEAAEKAAAAMDRHHRGGRADGQGRVHRPVGRAPGQGGGHHRTA